jgi:hypothetical protein
VRHAAAPRAASRSITTGAGKPKRFSAPADTIAARGETRARNPRVLDVALP